MDVPSGADDQVLGARRDEHLTLGQIGEVARVVPVAVEQVARRLRVAPVAARRRRPAELQSAFPALGQLEAGFVDDADVVARQRPAAADQAQRAGIVFAGGGRATVASEGLATDAVDDRAAVQRREGQPYGVLGEAINRRHRGSAKAGGGEALAEALDGGGVYRLGAVEGDPPGGEVESLQLLVTDMAQQQLVGEVRPARQGRAMAVDGTQPSRRTGEKGQRRHDDQRRCLNQRPQPGADQPHVVVEGQPAHEDVVGRCSERIRHRPDVGEQIGVGQGDALRRAGAPRGVLQQGHVIRCDLRPLQPVAGLGQLGCRHHVAQAGDLRLQGASQRLCFLRHDEGRGSGVGEDADVASHVLLDPGGAAGRIDRHDDGACDHGAAEGGEVGPAGRQHDGDRIAGADVADLQPGGDGDRFAVQRPVARASRRRRRPPRTAGGCARPAVLRASPALPPGLPPPPGPAQQLGPGQRLRRGRGDACPPRRCRRRRSPRARTIASTRSPGRSAAAKTRSLNTTAKADSSRLASSTRARLSNPRSRSSDVSKLIAAAASAWPGLSSRATSATIASTRSATSLPIGVSTCRLRRIHETLISSRRVIPTITRTA